MATTAPVASFAHASPLNKDRQWQQEMPSGRARKGKKIPGFQGEFFPIKGHRDYLISPEAVILSRRKGTYRQIGLNGTTATMRMDRGGYKRVWIRTLLLEMFPELAAELEASEEGKRGRGGMEAWRSESGQVKERECLGCGQRFLSNGPWNRNCGCARRVKVSHQRLHGKRIGE